MDYKPIITYVGSGPLFRSLESQLSASIPLDTCEWKRSYGRPNKNVRLEAQFQPFDAARLEPYKTGAWSIVEHPVLHIYVTDCNDVDAYKTTVKDEIEAWQKVLAGCGIGDWMILLVETVDMKKTKNLLQRTTVLDKMRLDFGAKHADRCISVLNPIKHEVKATESYRCLLNRIRLLMLCGFNKNIVKYEELIRANREKRNQEGWSFVRYFLLQEQLAFVLEMLGLHQEALVQYDELDAMFSQFVMNAERGERQPWLEGFERPLHEFHGITMRVERMRETRARIVDGSATLLEFRSYVFERQAVLLMGADQHWEIADRLLPFVYATLREIEALHAACIEGALACWQFVCAIEVLTLCDLAVESKDATNIFQYTAAIWNLAKDRLYELGKLCGLLPGFTPTSDQLHIVVQLSAGIGDGVLDEDAVLVERPVEQRSHSPNRRPKPCATERLKEALGSNQAFTKLFLELSELAISTYKHVSRLRSARLVGLDLGNFYCTLNQPQKAVVFFTDLLRELKAENWHYLASQTMLELANCYRKMDDTVAYTKTCAAIACCADLEVLVRTFYFDEFLRSLKAWPRPKRVADATIIAPDVGGSGDDAPIVAQLEDHFRVVAIAVVAEAPIIQDEFVDVQIKVESNFPREVVCTEIAMSFEMHNKDAVVDEAVTDATALHSVMLPMAIHLDFKQDNTLDCASVVCETAKNKQPVRRTSSTRRKITPTTRKNFTNHVAVSNVSMKPGSNVLTLRTKATRVGLWTFRQLSIIVDSIEFLSETLPVKQTPFEITTKAASAILSFKNLIAGLPQPVLLIVSAGSFVFPPRAQITLRCSKHLLIRQLAADDDGSGHTEPTFRSDLVVDFDAFRPFDERHVQLQAICELPGQRDEKHIEHHVLLQCPWSRTELHIPLHFMPPITASCRLHSSETRKFLQVIIKGTQESQPVSLFDATMLCDHKGVNLKDRNPRSQRHVRIGKALSVSYLWEIEVEPLLAEGESPVIKVQFGLQYAGSEEAPAAARKAYSCKFDVSDYTTLFRIQAKVDASELCRVGSVCNLTVRITKIQDNPFVDLMYEVMADQNIWAVCGRSAGVVSMRDIESQSVILDVLPLSAGFLPMPNIRLSKYIAVDKSRGEGLAHPKLQPFPPGQVYNATKSIQIHVLASNHVD